MSTEPARERTTDPPVRELQHDIDTRFATEASHWESIYSETEAITTVYRLRHATALAWLNDLNLPPGSRVLEVGCGAGLFAADIAASGFRVYAIDRVDEMVQLTRERAKVAGHTERITVQLADAAALPFGDGEFAAVVCLGLLPWLSSVDDCLREVARVIAPGGFLLVSADNRHALVRWLDPTRNPLLRPLKVALQTRLERHGRWRRDASAPPQAPLSTRSLRTRLRRAGLETVRSVTLGFSPITFVRFPVTNDSVSGRIEARLHNLVDRGVPVVSSLGSQHLSMARRDDGADPGAGS